MSTLPKPDRTKWFKTKISNDGWLMPEKDRGFVGEQETLFDLDNYVIPNCTDTRVAVQAGSGIGMWPARLSETFEVVYTFEPNPELFYCVGRNAPQENIFRFPAALGYDRGTVDMTWGYRKYNYGGYYVVEGGRIPTLRVDDLQLSVCDLLMLDIEGRELEALKGADETLSQCKPTVVFESKEGCLNRFGSSRLDVRRWLEHHGYESRFTFHKDKDELWTPRN